MLSFAASALAVSVTFVAALVPPISGPVPLPSGPSGGGPAYPAPAGYLLPLAGGEIHGVTQGEETTFTHNGTAAYAYDFDMNYDTVVASRGGRVQMVYDGSNSGGCNVMFSSSSNYVVIDHGDGTSALYLHLAYASAQVQVGQIVDQGQPLAISGETGLTCSGGPDGGPGPHLHFQVQRYDPARYFTQSLPIAFDDISKNSGVPAEGANYVSGNFGKGQPQKIKLTPYRVPRVFNPQAVASDPSLLEVLEPEPSPPPMVPPPPQDSPLNNPQSSTTDTPTPTATPTHTPPPFEEQPEPTTPPEEDDTPTPANTPMPPTSTPVPTEAPVTPEAAVTNAAATAGSTATSPDATISPLPEASVTPAPTP